MPAWYDARMQSNPTIDTYNQYAQTYDEEVIDFWNNFPTEFIEKFVSSLPGKRILSVGSGSGRDALILRNHGLEVVCQDGSQSMVDITAKLGFESHLAEFSDIDFPKASFDGIWAYTSLIHIPKEDARRVIQKLHNLIKPRGMLAFGAIQGDTAGLKEHSTMPNSARYFKKYTSSEAKNLIQPLGFTFTYESTYQPHTSVYINQLYKVT